MSDPFIIGRDEYCEVQSNGLIAEAQLDSRATTAPVSAVSIPLQGSVLGTLHVQAFASTDDEDRGGIVLRITIDSDAGAFLPYSVNIDKGVELHMAGDVEGKALNTALKQCLISITTKF